jgi:hypothetical protein
MSKRARSQAVLAAASVVLGCALAPALTQASTHSRLARSLLGSKRLWATIDVCNPTDQPDTVGVRGSMPGDGRAGDRMYMSFRLQLLESSTGRWTSLAGADSPQFISVGSGASPRQGGSSFVIKPGASRHTFMMRGLVTFQWRHGHTVIASATRTTTAGHQSFAGADPAGYSAASCSIG